MYPFVLRLRTRFVRRLLLSLIALLLPATLAWASIFGLNPATGFTAGGWLFCKKYEAVTPPGLRW